MIENSVEIRGTLIVISYYLFYDNNNKDFSFIDVLFIIIYQLSNLSREKTQR